MMDRSAQLPLPASSSSTIGTQDLSDASVSHEGPEVVDQFYNVSQPWLFNPVMLGLSLDGLPMDGVSPLDMAGYVPLLVPVFLPYYYPSTTTGEQNAGGIFAVPMVPFVAPLLPLGVLIPFTYNISIEPAITEGVGSRGTSLQPDRPPQAEAEEGAIGGHGLHHRPVPAGHRRAEGQEQRIMDAQRQIVVQRFHVGFHIELDLLLIIKLAVLVYIFNQNGSTDRLLLLLFLATIVYLYQTGALSPLLQWISQTARQAMMPPQPVVQQPHVHAAATGEEREVQGGGNIGVVDGQVAGGVGGLERIAEEGQAARVFKWWGFLKEIQMLVVGFLTSLLPGFQHID